MCFLPLRSAPARADDYIPVAWVGENAVTNITKKWFFVNTRSSNRFLEVPVAPPQKLKSWGSGEFKGPRLEAVYDRILVLREGGLTGHMVVKEFVKRRIAPLQWHSEPMWTFSGPEDRMRLSVAGLSSAERKQVLRVLFATTTVPAPTNDDALPLFAYMEENVREARSILPSFDEWGIRPAGLCGPRYNPWAKSRHRRRPRTLARTRPQEVTIPLARKGPPEVQTLREAPSALQGTRRMGRTSKIAPPAVMTTPSAWPAPDASQRARRRGAATEIGRAHV